jgi:hypothetical protein
MGLEATEHEYSDGPIDRYVNTRFTGDPDTDWAGLLRPGIAFAVYRKRR